MSDNFIPSCSSDQLAKALQRGGWPIPNDELTEGQIKAAHAVVKANALNESDYQLLADVLGI